jgi:regulator of protease activity HflC (stomatin/prohibitin superfamily)
LAGDYLRSRSTEAQIDNLELLLRDRSAELSEHLLVVRTEFNTVSLVRCGQKWLSIPPNQIRAFWQGFIEVESHTFNLDESLELPPELVRQLRGIAIDGLKKIQLPESELGLLYAQNNFIRILESGEYAFWTFNQNLEVKTFTPAHQPEAKIDNLESLLKTHTAQLEKYLLIIKTEFDRAALIRCDRSWFSIAPNQLRAFWRQSIDLESHIFNLAEGFELPIELVQQLRDTNLTGLKRVQINESEVGLLYAQNNFIRVLAAGEYAFWTLDRDVNIRTLDRTIPNPEFPQPEVLIDRHPEFVREYCTTVQLADREVAIVRHLGKIIDILPPTSRKLFWQGVDVEIIDIANDPKLPTNLASKLGINSTNILLPIQNSIHICQVPDRHIGLLYIDRSFQSELIPGIHTWWAFGRSFQTEVFDLRLQNLEVSGQDILSKDKVPLRLNLTAGFRIEDILRAKNGLSDVTGFLYKELQFALRAAVGEQTLDAILENKGAIDRSIADYIRTKTAEYGIIIDSVGVKDIILPGEIKTILSKVVEAEKSAQANVIRRREETAATRSMLNTARVMEDNPVALRLKELEILERIAEKIDRIQVNGGLDNILTDLIKIDRDRS